MEKIEFMNKKPCCDCLDKDSCVWTPEEANSCFEAMIEDAQLNEADEYIRGNQYE